MLKNFLYVLFVHFFYCLFPIEAIAQVIIKEHAETFSLERSLYYYQTNEFESLNQDTSLSNIVTTFKHGEFSKPKHPCANLKLGTSHSTCWLAIPLSNLTTTNASLELAILNPDISTISFYHLDKNNQILSEYNTGKSFDFSSRPLQTRFFIFPFNVHPGESNLLMLKIKMKGYPFYAPISLSKQGYHIKHDLPFNLFYTFFSGMMLFVVVISILLFIVIKKKLYLLYGTYILFATLYFLGEEGMDFQLFYPSLQDLVSYLPSVYGCLALFFVIQFTTNFLELKILQPKLFKLVRIWEQIFFIAFLIGGIIYVANNLLHTNNNNNTFPHYTVYILSTCVKLFVLSGWILQMFIVLYMAMKKNINAYFYLVAISSLLFTTTYNILCALGIIHKMYLPINPMIIGFLFEIIILSFALIYRANLTEQKKSTLEIELKHTQLIAAEKQIKIQENERNRIAKDLHDDIGSNLACLKLQIEGMKNKSILSEEEKLGLLQMISDSSVRLSDITHNLMPPSFNTTSLPNILDNYFNHIIRNSKIFFEFYIISYKPLFTKDQELIIYRIALELSQNIIKHANASSASIQLIYNNSHLNIIAEDNGIGIRDFKAGLGLESITSRVEYLEGEITIDTGISGTLINIDIPIKQTYYEGQN